MSTTDKKSPRGLTRRLRLLPMAAVAVALMAGSLSVSAQQYIAERINDEYQAQLAQQRAERGQVVAKISKKTESQNKKQQKVIKPYVRPIHQPES